MPIGAGFVVAYLQKWGFSPALKFLTRAIEGVVDDSKNAAYPTSYGQVRCWRARVCVCVCSLCYVLSCLCVSALCAVRTSCAGCVQAALRGGAATCSWQHPRTLTTQTNGAPPPPRKHTHTHTHTHKHTHTRTHTRIHARTHTRTRRAGVPACSRVCSDAGQRGLLGPRGAQRGAGGQHSSGVCAQVPQQAAAAHAGRGWRGGGCVALCCAALRCAALRCAVLCCAVLCCAVLCCAVLCCAVLCCAVLCCVRDKQGGVVGCGATCVSVSSEHCRLPTCAFARPHMPTQPPRHPANTTTRRCVCGV
jgi:hypothetical protein